MTNDATTYRAGQAVAPENDRSVTPIIVKLLQNADAALEADRAAARAALTQAAALLQAAYDREAAGSPRTEDGPILRGGLAPWQIRRVTAHIEANLESTIRLEELSQLTRLSTSYFMRAFKESVGVSPHAYVNRRRVARAQEMMLTTDEPLSRLSIASGLCDQAHFSNLFRRVVGTSPNAWRRQRRVEPLERAD